MSDESATIENQTTIDTTATPAAPVEVEAERKFSQADVDRIVGERLKRVDKSQPKPQAAARDGGEVAELRRQVEELQQMTRFQSATAEIRLNAAQRDALGALHRMEKPDNVADWAKEKVAALGWVPSPAQPQAPARALPVASAPDRVISDVGAPAPSRPQYAPGDNPLHYDQATIAQIRADKGLAAGNKWIRQQAEAALANVLIQPNVKR